MATSKGLPGFLRRVGSPDYSDDEASSSSASSIPEAATTSFDPEKQDHQHHQKQQQQQQQQQQQAEIDIEPDEEPKSSPSILDSSRGRTLDSSQAAAIPSRASMPLLHETATPSKPLFSPLNRQSSEPTVTHSKEPINRTVSEGPSVSQHRASQSKQQQLSSTTCERGRPKTYRETQFEKIFAANVVSMNELRTLSWNGVPAQYRPQSWKILLGYLPTNATRRQQTLKKKRSEYRETIAQHYDIDDNSRTIQEQEVLRQVLVDVPRTAPTVGLFRDERIKQLLTRVLYIWAMRHPASSYVQGINDLAMPLIVTFLTEKASSLEEEPPSNDDQHEILSRDNYEVDYDVVLDGRIMESVSDEQLNQVEADSYWCLTNLLAGIQDHYTSDQPGVQRMVLRLEELVNRIDADLCAHLRDTGIEFMQFAFKWMNCLLLREFNLKCVIRLWDTYISEKDGFEDFHVYVCAAFLCQFSSQLQAMSFDDLFGFMQAMPTGDWGDTEVEMLLSQAYVLSTLFGGSDAHLTAPANNGRF